MKLIRGLVPAILLSFCSNIGVVEATPLATFETVTAQDYVNFPFGSQDVNNTSILVSGVLILDQPAINIFAMGTDYAYDYSLIAYFEFTYGFIGDHGETVTGQYFQMQFDSPSDYIDIGRIPGFGLPYTQTFGAAGIIAAFNSEFHGLQDNTWWIDGFRASVRHIYQPVPEPATMILLGSGFLIFAVMARRKKT